MAEAENVGPLKSLVATVAEEYEQKILNLKKTFEKEKLGWRETQNRLERKIEEKNVKILDLQEQSRRLEEEVGNLYRELREEKAAKRLLIADLNGRNRVANHRKND